MRQCGISGGKVGPSVPAAPEAVYLNRPMEEIIGARSAPAMPKGSLRNHGDAWPSPLPPRSHKLSTPTSNAKRIGDSTGPTTAGVVGLSSTPATTWFGVLFISAT